MALNIPALLTRGIALANKLTGSAQSSVLHYQWKRAGSTYGEPVYETPVPRQALVNVVIRKYKQADGSEIVERADIGFLEPIADYTATGRENPIDPRDKFVLANGYTAPVIRVNGGLLNPRTSRPFSNDVTLG